MNHLAAILALVLSDPASLLLAGGVALSLGGHAVGFVLLKRCRAGNRAVMTELAKIKDKLDHPDKTMAQLQATTHESLKACRKARADLALTEARAKVRLDDAERALTAEHERVLKLLNEKLRR